MEGISDLKVIGIDSARPPRIRKEPYIELYFKLIHKAPKRWCDEFNHFVAKGEFPIKIDPKEGLFIDTWVRKLNEIEIVFNLIKKSVSTCNKNYIARVKAENLAALNVTTTNSSDDDGEQGQLNRIIAGLNFDIEPDNIKS